METRSIKLIIFFAVISLSSFIIIQDEKYSTIPVEKLAINSFRYGGDIDNFRKLNGNPVGYKEYTDPYPLEGYGKSFYLTYDSMEATFVEFYNQVILSNITIKGSRYQVNIADTRIQVGDSFDKLIAFKKSYAFFSNNYKRPYDSEEQYFYINLSIKGDDFEYFGLINIKLREEKVVEIAFRFDEGS